MNSWKVGITHRTLWCREHKCSLWWLRIDHICFGQITSIPTRCLTRRYGKKCIVIYKGIRTGRWTLINKPIEVIDIFIFWKAQSSILRFHGKNISNTSFIVSKKKRLKIVFFGYCCGTAVTSLIRHN